MIAKLFSVWDYMVFVGLLLASSMIGVFFAWQSRRNPSSAEFLTGNRQLSMFPVTMSLVASFMSTNTLLGVPAEVFQVGTQFLMQVISITIAVILAAELFMPVYYDLKITTVNEYLERRFSSPYVKWLGIWSFLIQTMPYMAIVLYGPAVALAAVTPISINISILLVGFICTFYTSIGGIKAVIWTDVLQCILMFMGVGMVIFHGLLDLGGFSESMRIIKEGGRLKLFNMEWNAYRNDVFWNVVLGTAITWTGCYCICQIQVQRYCSMKSKPYARRTLYYNLPFLLILAAMAIMSGVVVYGKYHNCDPVTLKIISRHDQLVPYYVMDVMGRYPGIPGLFVACVFSGSLSTLSSGFNSLAAVTWEDILKHRVSFATNDAQSMRAVKLLAIFYGLLAIALSYFVGSLGTVMQASLYITSCVRGPFLAMYLMALLFRFFNSKGAIAGVFTGILLSITISVGAMVIPRPKVAFPTTIDQCSADIYQHYLSNNQTYANHFYQDFPEPEGIKQLFHISYLLLSVIGFVTTIVVGGVVSLITGGRRENIKLDNALLSPLAQYTNF